MCTASVYVKNANTKGNILPKYNKKRRPELEKVPAAADISLQPPVDAARLADALGERLACFPREQAPLPVAA